MKHNPKPEEKKAAGLDDDFAVKKDFAQSCTLRRIAAAVLYLSILFCCTITALKLPSLALRSTVSPLRKLNLPLKLLPPVPAGKAVIAKSFFAMTVSFRCRSCAVL